MFLLVCNSSHDGFYQVWLLAQLEGSVEELGVYHEHSPFRSDYNDIKDTPTELVSHYLGNRGFSSRYAAGKAIPGVVEPLFKGVELPSEAVETDLKKYRANIDLGGIYPNLLEAKYNEIEIYNLMNDDEDCINYSEEALNADCIEYLKELGIDVVANKIDLEDIIKVQYGSVYLCNVYAEVSKFNQGYNYEPDAHEIKINNIISRAVLKLQRKAEGLEEITATNIIDLKIQLDEEDFYPTLDSRYEEINELCLVKGVYVVNVEDFMSLDYEDEPEEIQAYYEENPDEFLKEKKDEFIQHAKDSVDYYKEQAQKLISNYLNLQEDQQFKASIIKSPITFNKYTNTFKLDMNILVAVQ